MKTQTGKIGQVALALFLGAVLTGCLTDPQSGESATGRVTLEISTPTVRAQGGTVPDLSRLEVTMVSSERDTVRDTITRMGSRLSTEPAYLDGQGGYVHLFARYELKAGRSWSLRVRTFDAADTVIHEDLVTVQGLREYEYRPAALALEPRRLGYAVRVKLPKTRQASTVTTAETSTTTIEFRRVELLVDGLVERDTVLPASGKTCDLILTVPYLKTGAHKVELRAYGTVETVGSTGLAQAFAKTAAALQTLLLSGSTTIQAALSRTTGTEAEQRVSMTWNPAAQIGGTVLPAVEGEDDFQFRIGAVGRVVLNVVIPGAVAL